MGIFVSYPSNIFVNLSDVPQVIITADEHPLWVTSLIVCNRGIAPMRFNLQKYKMTGTDLKASCEVATTVNLNSTYNNGALGVGATLTNAGTLAAFSVDGISVALNGRVLVKNQTDATQNGVYTLSIVGDGVTAWQLTRATDFNTPFLIGNGSVVFINSGTLNSNTYWTQTSTVVEIGLTPIVFTAAQEDNVFLINELLINPYSTVNIIDITGVIQLDFNDDPFIQNWLSCFSNGYTQVFDCDVNYTQLNDLPM